MLAQQQKYRIEGWLKVCEYIADQQYPHSASIWPTSCRVAWHAGYVVIRQDDLSLICYKNEQAANRACRHLPRIRLDGGYKAFYRKWGYPTPPPAPSRPFLMVMEPQSEEDDETSDDVLETVSLHESLYKTSKFVKSYTTYDLIESPGVESQSLDRRRGWSTRRVMPSSTNAPFVPDNSLAIVESPSTSHKLANFLSRPFRNNPLKRTKSVSKLDRKRSALDPDGSNNWSNISPTTVAFDNSTNRTTSNIRNSRSHDSLLSYSTTTHAIDLAASGCTVTPLHTSVLGTPHCFRINTDAKASKYYACRSAAERDRWMESLKRTMQPNLHFVRRQENSLQLWIFAAKGIPCKRRYYCEVCLDHTLYSRTTSKFKAKDECFWGENFEINHLPKLESVCVNLYREAERKKKKDRNNLIGYVQIPVSILTVRYPVEKWYVVHGAEKMSSKGEIASLRVKARYQTVTILPLRSYDSLLQNLRQDYLTVCSAVENLTSVKSKEDIATCLVRILHKEHLAKDFLCDLVMCEVQALDNYHLMFRGNSLATKAMEAYMKLIGDQYLHETLSEFIQNVLESDDDCEIDPSKLSNLNLLGKHQELLLNKVHMAWGKIVNSFYDFPSELRLVFYELRRRLENCGRQELGDYLISSNIFLRFLCPSVLSPSLFNLVQEYPNEKTVRNLTLIAKTIQTLANFTKFGVKEQYMEFMNKFIEGECDHMRQFLFRISAATNDYLDRDTEPWEGNVDIAKELSLLHAYLVESWPAIEEKNGSLNLSNLKRVLEYVSECLRNPASDAAYCQQLQNICTPNGDSSSDSPTSPTSDYENYNNNGSLTSECSVSDEASSLNSQRSKSVLKPSSIHNALRATTSANSTLMSPHRKPATNLHTDDDYVWYSAINENLGLRRTGMVVQQNRMKHANTSCNINGSNAVKHISSAAVHHVTIDNDGAHDNYLNNFGGINDALIHDSCLTEEHHMHGSQSSLVNGPISSGYQSLNYSTSNSSSPVENVDGRENKTPVHQQQTKSKLPSLSPFPLSIANPMYSLQMVPMVLKEKSASTFSLPDIQANYAPHRTMDGGISSPGHCVAPRFMTPQSRRYRIKNSLDVQPIAFSAAITYPLLTHTMSSGAEDSASSGEQSPTVNSYNRSSALPRTNPRFVNCSVNSNRESRRCVQQTNESQCFIKNVDVAERERVNRVKDLEPENKSEEIYLNGSNVGNTLASHSLQSGLPVEVKPIINRLRLVEQELEEEQNSSFIKQQIIEDQQKRIAHLQSTNEELLITLSQLKETKLTSPTCVSQEISFPNSRSSTVSSLASSYETSRNDDLIVQFHRTYQKNMTATKSEPTSPQSCRFDSSSESFNDGLLSPPVDSKIALSETLSTMKTTFDPKND